MAFQGLNIIGSLTAGTNLVQGQASADRQRIEAYRSLLKDQVVQRKTDGTAEDHIEVNAPSDRFTIGDAPEERRPPYAPFDAKPPRPAKENADESSPGDSPESERIDIVI